MSAGEQPKAGNAPQTVQSFLASMFAPAAKPLDPFENEKLQDIGQERALRKRVAKGTMWGLAGQLALMDGVFIAYAWNNASSPGFADTFKWFFVGTLGEIFGIMWVLVAYLFPKNRPNLYEGH